MLKIDNNLFWKKYNALPNDLKQVIDSHELVNASDEIISKNVLRPSMSRLLIDATVSVVLGIIPLQKFRQTLQEKLEVPEEKARKIVEEIKLKIFANVMDSLNKIQPGANAATPEKTLSEYKSTFGTRPYQQRLRDMAMQNPYGFWIYGKDEKERASFPPDLQEKWRHYNSLYVVSLEGQQ